jgi:hypothetical protein
LAGLSAAERTHAAPALAEAFGFTFWVAVGLITMALLASLRLPRQPAAEATEPPATGQPTGGTHLPPAARHLRPSGP